MSKSQTLERAQARVAPPPVVVRKLSKIPPPKPNPNPVAPEPPVAPKQEAKSAAETVPPKQQPKPVAQSVVSNKAPPPEVVERRREMLIRLCELFPQCFHPTSPRPLKAGIHQDIAALHPEFDAAVMSSALRYFTRNGRYLAAMVAGAPRIDLRGEKDGAVTAEQAASAAACLVRKKARARQAAARSSPTPASRP